MTMTAFGKPYKTAKKLDLKTLRAKLDSRVVSETQTAFAETHRWQREKLLLELGQEVFCKTNNNLVERPAAPCSQ